MQLHPLRALTLLAAAPALAAAQATLQVPGSFPTIQSAIDAAQSGDTILVAPGTYNERIATFGKELTIAGSGDPEATVLDGAGVFEPIAVVQQGIMAVVYIEPGQTGVRFERLTITGATQSQSDHAVRGPGSYTVLEDCILRDNQAIFGAFWGSGELHGCRFFDNRAGDAGGAIHGDPLIVDCWIEGNRTVNGEGGGVFATGPTTIVDSVIVGNQTGFDGYSGGGVAGPADLVGCLIADNQIGGNPFVGHYGAGLHDVGDVIGCTVVGNRLVDAECLFCGVGGIDGATSVVDTIVRDNDDVSLAGVAAVSYSNVAGGAAGPGNFDADPLFVDPLGGDYTLQAGSPCIDAGDPAGPLDADGTLGDVGAFPLLGPLTADGFELGLAAGGVQALAIDRGPADAGAAYLVVGTLSGTQPGTPVGGVLVPINLDVYTNLTLTSPTATPLVNSVGLLDAEGTASVQFVLPAGSNPALAGSTAHHAALLLGAFGLDASTNAVPLALQP